MEYNEFLRRYYEKMIENFKDCFFYPQNIFNVKIEKKINPNFYEKQDCGWFGAFKIKLGAPNEEYEYFFDIKSQKYPDYVFFIPSEELKSKSEIFNSEDDIQELFDNLKRIYIKMGLIEVANDIEE